MILTPVDVAYFESSSRMPEREIRRILSAADQKLIVELEQDNLDMRAALVGAITISSVEALLKWRAKHADILLRIGV